MALYCKVAIALHWKLWMHSISTFFLWQCFYESEVKKRLTLTFKHTSIPSSKPIIGYHGVPTMEVLHLSFDDAKRALGELVNVRIWRLLTLLPCLPKRLLTQPTPTPPLWQESHLYFWPSPLSRFTGDCPPRALSLAQIQAGLLIQSSSATQVFCQCTQLDV